MDKLIISSKNLNNLKKKSSFFPENNSDKGNNEILKKIKYDNNILLNYQFPININENKNKFLPKD